MSDFDEFGNLTGNSGQETMMIPPCTLPVLSTGTRASRSEEDKDTEKDRSMDVDDKQEDKNESKKLLSQSEQSLMNETLLDSSSSSSSKVPVTATQQQEQQESMHKLLRHETAMKSDDLHQQLSVACTDMNVDTDVNVNVHANVMDANSNNVDTLESTRQQETIKNNSLAPQLHDVGDTMEDIFPDRKITPTAKGRKQKKNNKKRKLIHIGQLTQPTLSDVNQCATPPPSSSSSSSFKPNNEIQKHLCSIDSLRFDDENFCSEESDALDFFSDMHEDQDPETIELIDKITKERIEADLKQISEQNEQNNLKIKNELKAKWIHQQNAFITQVKEWKQKLSEKQEAQRLVLTERFKVSMATKENEAREALKYVSDKTNRQIESIHRNYQQYPSWNQELDQRKTADLNKVKAQVLEVQRSIKLKLQSYKTEREADFKGNQSKLRNHHHTRREELETAIAQNKAKLYEKYKQQRLLLERLQHDRIKRLKDRIINDRSNLLCSEKEDGTNSMKSELKNKYNKPDESNMKQNDFINPTDAAIQRYINRQNVFMKAYIPISLHVQIYDEGLGITWKSNNKSSDKEKTDFDFMPWGFKARQFLHSIVCGELDVNDSLDIDTKCENLLQGGQVKCIISDARKHHYDEGVSDSKSKVDSDQCIHLKSIMFDLRQQLDSISKAESSCKEMLMKIELALRKYKDKMNETKRKHQGAQLSSDQQRNLTAAFVKYNNQILVADRKKQELQAELLKIQTNKAEKMKLFEHTQNEYEQAKGNAVVDDDNSEISNILDLIKKDMIKKKSTSSIFGEVNPTSDSNSKKDSITVILRPPSNMFRTFNQFVQHSSIERNKFDFIRAEQLLLLALYPSNKRLPSAPPPMDSSAETKPWVEPGSQLILEVSQHQQHGRTILPNRYEDTFFRQLQSECSSNKGRQASTLLNRQHYRCMTTGILQGSTLSSFISLKDADVLKSYEFNPLAMQINNVKKKHNVMLKPENNGVKTKLKATEDSSRSLVHQAKIGYNITNSQQIINSSRNLSTNTQDQMSPLQHTGPLNQASSSQFHPSQQMQFNAYPGHTQHTMQPSTQALQYNQMNHMIQQPLPYSPMQHPNYFDSRKP